MPADKHRWNLQYVHILFIDSFALQFPPSRHSWSSDTCSLTLRKKNSSQSVHVKTSKETPDDNPLQTTHGKFANTFTYAESCGISWKIKL
jgi:hypothetical protein